MKAWELAELATGLEAHALLLGTVAKGPGRAPSVHEITAFAALNESSERAGVPLLDCNDAPRRAIVVVGRRAIAERLACDANVARIVMAAKSRVLDLGRRTRVASPAQRTAVMARDDESDQS